MDRQWKSNHGLVLFGFLVGSLYLVMMFFGAGLFAKQGEESRLKVNHLEGMTRIPDRCTPDIVGLRQLEGNQFAVSSGDRPDVFLIEFETSPPDGLVFYLGAIVDRAKLVVCGSDGAASTIEQSGDHLPFSIRSMRTAEIAFRLTTEDLKAPIWLEVVQGGSIILPFFAATNETFVATSQRKTMIRLFLLGSVTIMILYNFVIGFLIRKPVFTFNALTTLTVFTQDIYLSGLGAAYVWPEWPWLSDVVILGSLAGPTLLGPFFLYFFLEADNRRPFWRSPIYCSWTVASVICLTLPVLAPFHVSLTAAVFLWIAMGLFWISKIVQMALRGNERAAILLVPSMGVVVPAMTVGAFKIFFEWDFGPMSDHQLEIAMFAEALLFTTALAYFLRLSEQREKLALEEVNRVARQGRNRLLAAIDHEQRRIAGDLHDIAGQGIILVANRLKQLAGSRTDDEETVAELSKTESHARDLILEIRRASHELHPAALDHLGLGAALKRLVADVEAATHLEAELCFEVKEQLLSKNQALQIFRIIQELLNNVVTHANANRVLVGLREHQGDCILTVNDDGLGFSVSDSRSSKSGIGQDVVKERVEQLGGHLHLLTGASGTNIRIEFATVGQMTDQPD